MKSLIIYDLNLALSSPPDMTTYYYRTLEEALKKAEAAGKRPGYWYGGITKVREEGVCNLSGRKSD